MSLSLTLSPEDLPYEQEIVKNPHDINAWLRYVEFKQHAPMPVRCFVLERACNSLGRSYKLWKMVLDLRRARIKGLSCVKFHEEFAKLNNLYEKALILLHKMPRIWTDYLEHLLDQTDLSLTRKTFNRALQALPSTQHHRVWPLFLRFANELAGPKVAAQIWQRYIQFNVAEVETCIEMLTKLGFYDRAAKLLLRVLEDSKFVSTKGKSRFQLWEDLSELLVHHSSSIHGVNVEQIIRSGIKRYTDQEGHLWVLLATYWINCGEHERARDIFEEGLEAVLTVRDFSQVFDSYVEFEESLITKYMESDGTTDDTIIDRRIEALELLMDRRPFLLNDVRLRQDSNNVNEWEKRIALWGNNREQAVLTYERAIETIVPKRANGKLYQLWVNYAKFYETVGNDVQTARMIFDKATKVPFKSVNELAETWIEWAEMELRHENFDQAIKIMQKATQGPKVSKVDYFDDSLAPQERLHKSMKLWSFYVDLVESVGELADVKPLYDRIFDLRIGTAMTVVNYANLLEENNYFEESFKVYERGLDLFPYPVAFELWNLYLKKAISRKLSIERLRDLFEQALEGCPSKFCKPLYLLYGKLEEDRGLVSNAIKIYNRATQSVDAKDRLEVYQFYISRVAENFGLAGTRPVFQKAVDNLNDHDANIVVQQFIDVEVKLGEIERARALFGYASQFNDPELDTAFWDKWDNFEIEYGNEDHYKEMLRIKRSVKAQFSRDVRYLARKVGDTAENEPENPLAALEKQVNAPLGFVASGEVVGGPKVPTETSNPDAIDIDIDI